MPMAGQCVAAYVNHRTSLLSLASMKLTPVILMQPREHSPFSLFLFPEAMATSCAQLGRAQHMQCIGRRNPLG